eukprot:CAMPEP_0119550942 /NCGR_PEP_ID=MMETSP1352-20130426/4353_1 /TAXON_ID=265584 /ORGANISM="Stauroneis constricta, Strain CCMP1120" /LENGTH=518 /DNA_ID=CAMNT_0007596935 /DNA_START=370 /DNA_END=1926 /DNA_ORIENTATION=+
MKPRQAQLVHPSSLATGKDAPFGSDSATVAKQPAPKLELAQPSPSTKGQQVFRDAPLVDVPPPASGWSDPQLKETPLYHPVHMCKNKLSLNQHSLTDMLERITGCMREMSIQAKFVNEPVSANMLTMENSEMHLALWKSKTSNEVLLEITRTKGDAMACAGYIRRIVEAASSTDLKEDHFRISDIFDRKTFESTEAAIDRAFKTMAAFHKKNAAKGDDDIDEDSDSDLSSKDEEASDSTPTPSEVFPNPGDDDVSSLEIVAKSISSKKISRKQIALESLVAMVNPRKTLMTSSIETALAVLTGTTTMPATAKIPEEKIQNASQYIHNSIMSLLLRREFTDFDMTLPEDVGMTKDADYDDFFPSDSDGEVERKHAAHRNARRPLEYVRFLNHCFHLALACVANSIELISNVTGHEALQGKTLQSIMASLAESQADAHHALIAILMDSVRRARRKQNRAYLSMKALHYLCAASPETRTIILQDSSIKEHIQEAHTIGCGGHHLLKSAAQRLWQTVYVGYE